MPRITKLIDIETDETICTWRETTFRPGERPMDEARLELALWLNRPLSEIRYDDDHEAGECFTCRGEPAAIFEVAIVANPYVNTPSVVDLKPFMQIAAE